MRDSVASLSCFWLFAIASVLVRRISNQTGLGEEDFCDPDAPSDNGLCAFLEVICLELIDAWVSVAWKRSEN